MPRVSADHGCTRYARREARHRRRGRSPARPGIGSGGILVPAFTFLLQTPVKAAIGASLTCFAANALISVAFKLGQGYIDFDLALPACAGTLAGANLGALLGLRLSSRALKAIFGLVFVGVALKFLLAGFRPPT